MSAAPEPGPVATAVTRSVRLLRVGRRWSALDLAKRTAAVGTPVPRSVIANMESGRRAVVTVDELAVFAAAFGVEPWSLTTDQPVCLSCRNDAPAGFACLNCGQGRPT